MALDLSRILQESSESSREEILEAGCLKGRLKEFVWKRNFASNCA